MNSSTISIWSGGQTGVDRAALDFAISKGLVYGGWCPHGGWAEDLLSSPGLRAKYSQLQETPSASPEQRTAWNVRDSHATLIIADPGGMNRSPGSFGTTQMAELAFLKPLLVADPADRNAVDASRRWLEALWALHVDLRLNIAGPR